MVCESFLQDEEQLTRWPLPLAQLVRRALNAKTILDRHSNAFFLFEAYIKLLGSVSIVEYARVGKHDPKIDEPLKRLARPSLGHWWGFVRLLVPELAQADVAGYSTLNDVLFGRSRSDLPRAAGLDAALRETPEGRRSQSRVRLSELFDRLIAYRNSEMGHGAYGQRPTPFYDKMSAALLAGMVEILHHVDPLAGRQLLYVSEVRRRQTGDWSVERYELSGETPRRLESMEIAGEGSQLPFSERVYVALPTASPADAACLYPLMLFDYENSQTYFLNSRRRQKRTEYLNYQTGDRMEKADLGREHRELLTRVLGCSVDVSTLEEWSGQVTEEAAARTEVSTTTTTLGEFDLLSELGRGAMGVVYRAWQPSLEREVALKSLLRVGDPKTEKRFNREIRALGRVEHPNLVKIFTSGADRDRWFYAMELIEGTTLADLCEALSGAAVSTVDDTRWRAAITRAWETARKNEKSLGPDCPLVVKPCAVRRTSNCSVPSEPMGKSADYIANVVELIRQTSEAAHALHEEGIIHRDVKPANVMVTERGSRAVLTDLGLAKIADEMTGTSMGTRGFVGTLRYASPEQLEGLASLDRRADIYSLGATLWELVTLRPFLGISDDTPTPELILKIHQTEAEDPRQHNPALPSELAAVILKCVEKDRDRRYPSAREFASDLARWQKGELVLAQPMTTTRRIRRRLRRHRSQMAWTALGVAASTLGAILLSRL